MGIWIALIVVAMLAGAAQAQPLGEVTREGKPLWEAGVGAGGGWLPDYPAAGQNHAQAVPLPYVIYRGEIVSLGDNADGSMVRGLLFDNRRVALDLSFSGSFPASSDDNDAREGLPDLDWLGEIGPRLSFYAYRHSDQDSLRLDLRARGVFSTDLSSVGYEGLVFNPAFVWQIPLQGPQDIPMRLSNHLGATFATEEMMDYFYEVDEEFVTPQREAFDAEGGYLGSYLTTALVATMSDRVKFSLGGSYAYHGGATNDDSPLFLDGSNLAAFAGMIWSFYKSDRLARSSNRR